MPHALEQTQATVPNQLPASRETAASVVGFVGLSGIEAAAGHFYGGDNQFIGNAPGGEHRLIINSANDDGTTNNEVVGVGKDVETVLLDSLVKMRMLETVHTRALAHIEMTDEASISFTSLEHYSPKVAPSRDHYPIPDYLEAILADSKEGDETYRNTLQREGWQAELHRVLVDYLQNDSGGQQLLESLKIRSLSHLTPEQAIKLSAAFVQNVSKYTTEDVGSNVLTRADQSNAAELLKEGIAHKNDPHWKGNGVCRNIASNVKAVFEALKASQADLSMLNNTYAVYGSGVNGAGYADSRADNFFINTDSESGHAWNTFVTLDSKGSAVATIIDATWALGRSADTAMQHLDRTQIRAAAQIMQLFEKSEVKANAFLDLTDYVQRLMRSREVRRLTSESGRRDIYEYVTTEYLKAAAQISELPDGFALPGEIVSNTYRLRGVLERQEIATLFALDEASGGLERERIKAIIAGYDGARKVDLQIGKSAENLIFDNDTLQMVAFEAVGEVRVVQLAEHSGAFRARLREIRPEMLPTFNALKRPADAQELSYLAARSGIHARDPAIVMRGLHNRLRKAANDDDIYQAIVVGRTDYDLAKNASDILKILRNRAKS